MKKTLSIVAVILINIQLFYAQDKIANKPVDIFIINDEIVTMAQIEKYGNEGYIKSMNKGVSEEEREKLVKKYGNKISDKEFITIIKLYSEKEKNENISKQKTEIIAEKKDEYILTINDIAKDFRLQLVDGKTIKLSDLKGKVVLVNFWATWCGPCLKEFYDIPSKITEPFKKEDFVFLAISIGEKKEKVSAKAEKLIKDGLSFNFGFDSEKKIWNEYAVNSIPKNFIIDKKGIIRYVSTGNTEGNLDQIATEIKRLLKE